LTTDELTLRGEHTVDEHDHVCLVYDDPSDQFPVLVPYMREGLRRGERCVWVVDDLSPEEARRALAKAGVDVERHLEQGSLRLWTRREWRPKGPLVPETRLCEVRDLVLQAMQEGFRGIRFAIEMTWLLGPDIPSAEVRRWEGVLDGLFREGLPVRMICQYSARRLSPDLIDAGLRTHGRAAFGSRICANPYYECDLIDVQSPDEEHRVARMVGQIAHAIEDQERNERVRHALRAQFAVTRVLAESGSLATATPRLLAEICSSIGWEVGAIWTIDRAEGQIRCVDVHHVRDLEAPAFLAATRGNVLPYGIGLPGRVWQNGAPAWLPDVVTDDNFPRGVAARNDGLHAAFGFPIRFGGEVTGVLEFFSRNVREPDSQLLAMMDALGSQIGQFIERRRSEERLRDSERELADFFESGPVPLHWIGPDGVILRVNQAELDMMGYAREEYVGRHIAEFHVDPDAIEDVMCRLKSGETLVARPARLRRSDGSIRYVLIDSNVRFDDQGRLVHTRCFTRDVTEHRRAVEALRESEARLREFSALLERKVADRTADLRASNEQLVEFSYSASHDLRRPVRAIRGYTDALRDEFADRLDDSGREYLARIAESTTRMDRLISDLLDYSRVGRVDHFHEAVDLDRAVDEALVELEQEIAAAGAGVSRHSTSGPMSVHGHHAMLVQMISNLISNGIKFVAPGVAPRVRVRLESLGNRVRLSVEDNGIGIEPRHRERIFRVFERLHADGCYPGTGIGLAVVRKAAERMGGRVDVSSAPGGGSCFAFEIPVANVSRSASPPMDPAPLPTRTPAPRESMENDVSMEPMVSPGSLGD
jgi:PAS domain S-box-containing protein